MNLQYERIEQLCRQLGLQTVASQWSHHAQQTLAKDGSYADFVEAMLLHEYTAKQQRSQQIRENLNTFFAYPAEIRKAIYTTNAIESLNSVIRQAIKKSKVFPTDDSVRKVIYLAIDAASKKPQPWQDSPT